MTPSGWHDDAKNRDAGHDEMQAAVYRWLCQIPRQARVQRRQHGENAYDQTSTEFIEDLIEAPFIDDGRIICFADVCRSWKITEASYRLGINGAWVCDRSYSKGYLREIFEIKPKIYSVGALLRQTCTLAHIISGIRYKSDYHAGNRTRVIAVVPWNDPKAELYREMGGDVLLWDTDRPWAGDVPDEDGADTTL